jgi:transposase
MSTMDINNHNNTSPFPESVEDNNSTNLSNTGPRLKHPIRNREIITIGTLDALLPENHVVRLVWEYVIGLDLLEIINKIKSVPFHPGAPAISPYILMTLWLYATMEGITSAKTIARYCEEHIAYRWICGGVNVNEHTISDFRTAYPEAFSNILTQSVKVLLPEGVVSLETVAQDGMKVEANAGTSSFRRDKTLKKKRRRRKPILQN